MVGAVLRKEHNANMPSRNIISDYVPILSNNRMIIALRDPLSDTTIVHCVSYNQQPFEHHLHSALRSFIVSTIDVGYTIIGCTQDRGWIRELRSLTMETPHEKCTISTNSI
jgi:hypothetical protein